LECIKRAESQGATVHLGGERYGTQGYWVKPTIITNTRPDMEIVEQEMFGPVAIIIKFDSEDNILELANDPLYGLAASLFTKDLQRGVRIANKVQVGTVWVNGVNMLHPGVPYGGFKQSGIGRECGQYALDTCVVFFFFSQDLSGKADP
jgi:aldehyde dehydrogenase (NAD+)